MIQASPVVLGSGSSILLPRYPSGWLYGLDPLPPPISTSGACAVVLEPSDPTLHPFPGCCTDVYSHGVEGGKKCARGTASLIPTQPPCIRNVGARSVLRVVKLFYINLNEFKDFMTNLAVTGLSVSSSRDGGRSCPSAFERRVNILADLSGFT